MIAWTRRLAWQVLILCGILVARLLGGSLLSGGGSTHQIILKQELNTNIDVLNTTTTNPPTTIRVIANQGPQILVVYSGPTTWFDTPTHRIQNHQLKEYKYHLNFEYFLEHGVQCAAQDTLIVVTEEVYPHYKDRIQKMDQECQREHNHRVVLLIRQNKCLDLEAVRAALYEGHIPLQLPTNVSSYYDYFFYINCGVVGPSKDIIANNNNNAPWTHLFLSRLREGVKMTGLSLNCNPPHVQSMMYAMDKEALEVVLQKDLVFDCEEEGRIPNWHNLTSVAQHGQIVNRYERAMGGTLLAAGYGIDGYANGMGKPIFLDNRTSCNATDMWTGRHLRELNADGRIPYLNETIFFKDTRYLTPELAEEIGYKAEIWGNWE